MFEAAIRQRVDVALGMQQIVALPAQGGQQMSMFARVELVRQVAAPAQPILPIAMVAAALTPVALVFVDRDPGYGEDKGRPRSRCQLKWIGLAGIDDEIKIVQLGKHLY